MAQSSVTVRIDSEMKSQFDKLCEQFGMSLCNSVKQQSPVRSQNSLWMKSMRRFAPQGKNAVKSKQPYDICRD